MWKEIKALWQARRVHGLELVFDTALLVLRLVSISYWLRRFLPASEDPRHTVRDNVIDAWCLLQLLALVALVLNPLGPVADSMIGGYILFEIYLNLLNVVFIGKLQDIGAPPASVERSILLLAANILEVVLMFGVLYRDWLGISTLDGVFHSVLVLGTIGYPPVAGPLVLLVAFQVFLDLVLVVLVVSSFVGQLGLFSAGRRR